MRDSFSKISQSSKLAAFPRGRIKNREKENEKKLFFFLMFVLRKSLSIKTCRWEYLWVKERKFENIRK